MSPGLLLLIPSNTSTWLNWFLKFCNLEMTWFHVLQSACLGAASLACFLQSKDTKYRQKCCIHIALIRSREITNDEILFFQPPKSFSYTDLSCFHEAACLQEAESPLPAIRFLFEPTSSLLHPFIPFFLSVTQAFPLTTSTWHTDTYCIHRVGLSDCVRVFLDTVVKKSL